MKISEFKLRAISGINSLIDTYFGESNIQDKFINSTLKLLVRQNANKFDDVLKLFADENGEITAQVILEEYSKMIGDDGFKLDIRDFIENDMVKAMIPNKSLKISGQDILNLLNT